MLWIHDYKNHVMSKENISHLLICLLHNLLSLFQNVFWFLETELFLKMPPSQVSIGNTLVLNFDQFLVFT